MKFISKIFQRIKLFNLILLESVWFRKVKEKPLLVAFGPIYFQVMRTAVEMDLFTKLKKSGPQTRSQIAGMLGISEYPVRIILSVLVATGFLKRIGGANPKYKNTLFSKIYLDREAKTNMVSWIDFYHHIAYRPMFYFHESAKENTNVGIKEYPGDEPTLYQRLARVPAHEKILEDALSQLSRMANKMLAEFVDLSKVKNMIDVGGGDATNILALAKKHPNLKATVFDSPTVCALAENKIQNENMADRCGTMGGDCFKDDFPGNIDCVLFSHFLDIWDEQQNLFLIKKSFNALNKGGQVIILEIPQWENEKGPHEAISTTPYFLALASGRGYMYTAQEYAQWLKTAGFTGIQFLKLPMDHVAVRGFKP
jgi:ubiquinone/menaquinone biosynthesis C-methylase UbiE